MNELVWSSRFIKGVKKTIKRNPELSNKIEQTLEKLEKDIFEPSFISHKLKGPLSGCMACSVDYDYRIIFEIRRIDNSNKTEILLLSIGTHNEVY